MRRIAAALSIAVLGLGCGGSEEAATTTTTATTTAATPTRPVYRITCDIAAGALGADAIAAGAIEPAEIPEDFLPVTAIVDLAEIESKVAVANLAVGQVLVEDMFVDPLTAPVTAPAGRTPC
jgi:hypothetical protein